MLVKDNKASAIARCCFIYTQVNNSDQEIVSTKRFKTSVLASVIPSAVGSNKLILAAVRKGISIINKRFKIDFSNSGAMLIIFSLAAW